MEQLSNNPYPVVAETILQSFNWKLPLTCHIRTAGSAPFFATVTSFVTFDGEQKNSNPLDLVTEFPSL